MFFSVYQSQNISTIKETSPKPLLLFQNKTQDAREPLSSLKSKAQTEEINWIRKKHTEFDDYNSLTPINISLSYNVNSKRRSKLTLKDLMLSNRKPVQQNPQLKQKRFHSESIYTEQKKRKSQYSKFFNQTLIDTEHNFIGKSYLRQVKNCKIHPKAIIQSLSVSPQKLSSPKKSQSFSKQATLTPFSNGSTTKMFQSQRKSDSFVYLNKKMQIKDLLTPQKSFDASSSQTKKINNVIVNKILIKEIQEKVKSDIKSQIKILKNIKLNKLKFKINQNSQEVTNKKVLQIQKSQASPPQKSKKQSQTSSKKNLLMNKYSDSDIKFRQHFKNGSKVRRLQTSAQSYEEQCYKVLNEHSIEAIPEDLRPWDSENLDYFQFR